jgi:hypothetical protein
LIELLILFVQATVIQWQVGDRCSAKWSQDQQWYSARITRIENGKYDVIFLDYGNSESGLGYKALRPEKNVRTLIF